MALADVGVALVIVGESYRPALAEILPKERLVYVCLGASCEIVEKDICGAFFIDAFTAISQVPPERKDAVFVYSPASLDVMSIEMTKAMKGNDFLVFDSLSDVLLHHPETTVLKFAHFIASKLRVMGKQGMLLVREQDASLAKGVEAFADTQIKIKAPS